MGNFKPRRLTWIVCSLISLALGCVLLLATVNWSAQAITAMGRESTPRFVLLPTIDQGPETSTEFIEPLHVEGFNIALNTSLNHPVVVEVFGFYPDGCDHSITFLISYQAQQVNVRFYRHDFHWSPPRECTLLTVPYKYLFPIDVGQLTPSEYTINVMGQTRSLVVTENMIASAKRHSTPRDSAAISVDNVQVLPHGTSEYETGMWLAGFKQNTCSAITGLIQTYASSQITLTPIVWAGPQVDCSSSHTKFANTYPIDLAYLPVGHYTIKIQDHQEDFWLQFGQNTPPLPSVPAEDKRPPSINGLWLFE